MKNHGPRLKQLLILLILLLSGVIFALIVSPSTKNLLRTQVHQQGVMSAIGYWPGDRSDMYEYCSSGDLTNVRSSFATTLLKFMDYCSGDNAMRLSTTPIRPYYQNKYAEKAKRLNPYNPWQQIYTVAGSLTHHYVQTNTCECCRNYALDMNLIIPLLGWGDAQVTVDYEYIDMDDCLAMLGRSSHVLNVISVTVPSGQYTRQTFRYAYDASWFPDRLIPYDEHTREVHSKHMPGWFPWYPGSTPPPQRSQSPSSSPN